MAKSQQMWVYTNIPCIKEGEDSGHRKDVVIFVKDGHPKGYVRLGSTVSDDQDDRGEGDGANIQDPGGIETKIS